MKDKIKKMTTSELEARKAAIATEVNQEGADLNALEEEIRAIAEELEARKAEAARREEIRKAAATANVEGRMAVQEEKAPTLEEIRSSKAYINAFADYIKTGDDTECRALLSTNATSGGQVPVPTVIEGRIRTAWERNGLMELVRKTYIRGNLQIGFELSATGAVIHAEGADAPDEEVLTFGVVTMVPASIKKWITISDEAMDMGGEEFLYYIYDELTYQIAKKAEGELIDLIVAAGATATATAVGVPVLPSAPELATVVTAMGLLSDEAANPVLVMNKATYAAMKAAQYAGNFAVDPFEGLKVYFNNKLPAVATATNGQTWMIVGDFGLGAHANFPNGDEIRIKYDELSLAEKDLVKLVGREYIALGLVADKAFVKVTKAAG